MARKAIVVFAEGFEETEAVATADILRRAGVDLALVGLSALYVTGSHGITVKMDRTLADKEDVDAIILPGGQPGADHLAASQPLARLLKAQAASGRLVAAICASPACVLAPIGLLDGRKATCYPGYEKRFGPTTAHLTDDVVADGNVITSRGPGTALAFGLALARALASPEKADELAKATLFAH